jgi:hypothetical protein
LPNYRKKFASGANMMLKQRMIKFISEPKNSRQAQTASGNPVMAWQDFLLWILQINFISGSL